MEVFDPLLQNKPSLKDLIRATGSTLAVFLTGKSFRESIGRGQYFVQGGLTIPIIEGLLDIAQELTPDTPFSRRFSYLLNPKSLDTVN